AQVSSGNLRRLAPGAPPMGPPVCELSAPRAGLPCLSHNATLLLALCDAPRLTVVPRPGAAFPIRRPTLTIASHESTRTPRPVVSGGPVRRTAAVRSGGHRPDDAGGLPARPRRRSRPGRVGPLPPVAPQARPRPADDLARARRPGAARGVR